MPDSKDTLKDLRMQLEGRLKSWIPDNDNLVMKGLQIFDRWMSRRSFLKTTSAATLTMMVGQGCGGAPSEYDDVIESDFENGVISESAKASVTTPSNIAIDADIHSSIVSHNPLPAYRSIDSNHVKDHAVIESFNPHVMTTDATDELTRIGFNAPRRTYGIPEHVHLSKDSQYSDYYLSIYEKSHDAQHGLAESKISLNGTAGMNFNSLIATNGTFHNKVSGNTAHGQKLALLANISNVGINYSDTSHLRLYYQASASELLEPSVEVSNDYNWNYIDVIEEFKKSENHPFTKYKILDANVYHDGHHHSFIYGTVSFDTYYYYGFVVTFNNITDTKPSITFFTPEFLSYRSDTIQTLYEGFQDLPFGKITNYDLEDISIFHARNFQPVSQDVERDGTPKKQIYFSFSTLNVGENDVYIGSRSDSYDLSRIVGNTYAARYLVSVDTTKKVDYLFSGYDPAAVHFSFNSYGYLSFEFDTSNIPAADLWTKVYDKDETLIFDSFVRSIQSTGNSLEVILASSYYNENSYEMGLVHKFISIQDNSATVDTAHTLFEDGHFLDKNKVNQDYKTLWHGDMKSHLGGYESLYEAVFKNNGMQSVQFHCTHNHQGLLRSYYIIRNGSDSLLIGFNEKGQESDNTIAFQNHENLRSQIQNNFTEHYPPMPVAINPKYLHKWHGVVEDGEVLFTSVRQHKIDHTNKKLVKNEDPDLLSYMHSSCNLTQKNWNMHENKIHIDSASDTSLVSADLHQVHLHVTNIYRHPVSLHKSKNFDKEINKNIFVEVRFNKRLSITDHTDPNNPKTYHPGANSSLFLSTDKSGRISLEIDAGGKNDKYNGAQMQYRLVDKTEIIQKADKPLASVESKSGRTTQFKKCNISFKIYQRLSDNQYNKPEAGIKRPGNKTVRDGLSDAVNNSGAVSQVAEGYGKLSQASHVSPENNSALISLSEFDTLFSGFASSVVHFHPISWVKHAASTALSDAQRALQEAKQAVNKLAHSINDAIINIEDNIVTAIEDIATAVENLWDDAVSLAEKLWDYLMAMLDLETAYDIGQELKNIRYDQLKPFGHSDSQNKHEKNIYTIFGNTENLTIQITSDVKSKAENVIKDIFDNKIFQTQKLTGKLDSQRNNGKNDHQIQQNNSTKITHVVEQLLRLKKLLKIDKLVTYTEDQANELKNDINNLMEDLFDVSMDDMFSGTFPTYLEDSILRFFDVDTKEQLLAAVKYYPGISDGPDPAPESLIRKIQNNAKDMQDHIQTFATGETNATDIAAQIEKNFKNTSLLSLASADELLDTAIKMPTEFLKDDKILKFMTSSGPALDKLLQPLGLLLFGDTSKFRNIQDTAAFTAGFAIHIAPLIAESAYNEVSDVYSKSRGEELNLSSFITDGTLRSNLNQFIHLSGKILTTLTSKVITVGHIKSVAKEIGKIMLVLTDKVLFKITGLVTDVIGIILTALEKITSLLGKTSLIKNIVADAISAVFKELSGVVALFKIQPEILNIGFAIADYEINNNRKIGEIVLMAVQAVSDTIKSIADFVGKTCEAVKSMGKGQPGEVVLYDPLRIAILSFAGFFVARLCSFVMDVISMGFKFAAMGYDFYSNGIADLLKDAAAGVTVVLELATVFLSFTYSLMFLLTETLGYIVKSTDIELIVAGAETIALPIIYGVAWAGYLVLLVTDPVLDVLHSLSSLSTNVAAFAETEA